MIHCKGLSVSQTVISKLIEARLILLLGREKMIGFFQCSHCSIGHQYDSRMPHELCSTLTFQCYSRVLAIQKGQSHVMNIVCVTTTECRPPRPLTGWCNRDGSFFAFFSLPRVDLISRLTDVEIIDDRGHGWTTSLSFPPLPLSDGRHYYSCELTFLVHSSEIPLLKASECDPIELCRDCPVQYTTQGVVFEWVQLWRL